MCGRGMVRGFGCAPASRPGEHLHPPRRRPHGLGRGHAWPARTVTGAQRIARLAGTRPADEQGIATAQAGTAAVERARAACWPAGPGRRGCCHSHLGRHNTSSLLPARHSILRGTRDRGDTFAYCSLRSVRFVFPIRLTECYTLSYHMCKTDVVVSHYSGRGAGCDLGVPTEEVPTRRAD